MPFNVAYMFFKPSQTITALKKGLPCLRTTHNPRLIVIFGSTTKVSQEFNSMSLVNHQFLSDLALL